MALDLEYSSMNDEPLVFGGSRAWHYTNGAWVEVHAGKAGGATIIPKSLFVKRFGELPPLPAGAFN